jgi:hypothetical protein
LLTSCGGPRTNEAQEALPKKQKTTVTSEQSRANQEQYTQQQQARTQQKQRAVRDENFLLGVGETAEIVAGQYKGLKITLVEVFTTPGTRWDKDALTGPNDTFLVARFRVENDGHRAHDILGSRVDFLGYNQDSYELDYYTLEAQYTTGAAREDQELIGQIRPGGDVVGTVAFVVKPNDSVLIVFTPMLEQLASWEVGPIANVPAGGFGAAVGQYE